MMLKNQKKYYLVVAPAIFLMPFMLMSTAYASISASSTNDEIIQDFCGDQGDDSIASFIECDTDLRAALENCEQTDSIPGVSRPEQRANCRQSVIDAQRRSANLDEIPSATSGDLMGDCEVRPLDRTNCGIINMIWIITDALAVLVSVVVIMTIVIGGIEYSAAGANPQAVVRAKKHITRALLAAAAFLFTYTIFEWLVPGGRFFL